MSKAPFFARLKAAANLVFRSSGVPEAWFNRAIVGGTSSTELAQPYAESVWVMRAIKKIASPIAAVPLKFLRGEQEFEDPALDAFWRQPARGLSRHDFIEGSIGWLKLAGESPWLLDDSTLRPFPEAPAFAPLILARPDRLREKVENGQLLGWEYRDATGKAHALLPEQVVLPKFWNPYNDWRGLAEYAAARIATEADYAAGEYQRNLMANNGDTGPIISTRNGTLNDDQQKQIISQLRMKQEYARRGEFRAAFLTADVTVQNPTAQTVDSNFAAMRLGNRHEIFLAFGVPPSMADKMESYSVGSASDWFMLITETCQPTAEKLAQAISEVARKQTGIPDLTAFFDWDEHPVLQTVRRERLDSVEKLWTKGMPLEAINEYLSLGMEAFPGWDVGYLPFSVAPVTEIQSPPDETTDPAAAEPEAEDDAVEEMKALLRGGASVPASRGPQTEDDETLIERLACCDHVVANCGKAFQDERPANQRKLWRAHMRQRLTAIRNYQSKFNRVLMTARAEVLGKLAADAGLKTVGARWTRAAAGDFLFNLDGFSSRLKAAMRQAAQTTLADAGKQLFAEIGKDDPFTMPPAKAIEFLAKRENRLSNVPDDVFERIRGALTEGLTEGDSVKAISDRVRAEFNEISKEQGLRIAMTETAAAYGTARQAAMEQAGIQTKEWLTSGNANVRQAHELMNNTRVGIAEDFTVIDPRTGESDTVKHPGDPSGAPWNVINCHCIALATEAETNA